MKDTNKNKITNKAQKLEIILNETKNSIFQCIHRTSPIRSIHKPVIEAFISHHINELYDEFKNLKFAK